MTSLLNRLRTIAMSDTVKSLTPPPTSDFQAWVRGLAAHPLANADRMMTDDELEGLKASIKAHGILKPIETYKGEIIDGRNRRAAGLAVGYKFKPADFVEFIG